MWLKVKKKKKKLFSYDDCESWLDGAYELGKKNWCVFGKVEIKNTVITELKETNTITMQSSIFVNKVPTFAFVTVWNQVVFVLEITVSTLTTIDANYHLQKNSIFIWVSLSFFTSICFRERERENFLKWRSWVELEAEEGPTAYIFVGNNSLYQWFWCGGGDSMIKWPTQSIQYFLILHQHFYQINQNLIFFFFF